MSSPTQRSREWFKKLGIPSAITERWNPHAKVRQDLFGFADLVALIPGRDDDWHNPDSGHILAVQVTSDEGGNVSSRFKKIVEDCPHARDWLESGGRIVVHGWGKRGAAGKRKLWTLRSVPVTLADLPEVPPRPTSKTGR